MTRKVYSFISPKGGSGKTVLCASFGAFLAALDKMVLIIDADAATHGLTLLYLSEVNSHRENILSSNIDNLSPNGIYDTKGELGEEDLIRLNNNVFLLPATYSFTMKEIITEDDLRERLIAFLNGTGEKFDYILIDAQAGSGDYVRTVLSREVSREVIIVSEYDPLSAAGVERLKVMFGDDLLFSRTWVLLNKMLPEFIESFSDFLEVSRYLPPIPWDPDVVRAYARRVLPLDLNYGNPYTLAIMQTMKRLFGSELASEINLWAENRATSIREPIEEQYRDAELELKSLLEQQRLLKTNTFKSWFRRTMTLAALSTAVTALMFLATLVLFSNSFSEKLQKLFLDSNTPLYVFAGVISVLVLTLVITLVTFTGPDFLSSLIKPKVPQKTVEEVRLQRQLDLVEERLKKLEALRKANLETLIKEGIRNQ